MPIHHFSNLLVNQTCFVPKKFTFKQLLCILFEFDIRINNVVRAVRIKHLLVRVPLLGHFLSKVLIFMLLQRLVAAQGLVVVASFDATLAPHQVSMRTVGSIVVEGHCQLALYLLVDHFNVDHWLRFLGLQLHLLGRHIFKDVILFFIPVSLDDKFVLNPAQLSHYALGLHVVGLIEVLHFGDAVLRYLLHNPFLVHFSLDYVRLGLYLGKRGELLFEVPHLLLHHLHHLLRVLNRLVEDLGLGDQLPVLLQHRLHAFLVHGGLQRHVLQLALQDHDLLQQVLVLTLRLVDLYDQSGVLVLVKVDVPLQHSPDCLGLLSGLAPHELEDPLMHPLSLLGIRQAVQLVQLRQHYEPREL